MRKLWLAILSIALAAGTAQAQTYKVLYNFGTHPGDPVIPYGAIAQGRDGSLYSTTRGDGGWGTSAYVFRITPSGAFAVVSDLGLSAIVGPSGLTLGTDGNFWGTQASRWTVFKVDPVGHVNTVYAFTGGSDGALPESPPIQGIDGNWYGTTLNGGNTTCVVGTIAGCGTIYELTSGTLKVLHSFSGGDGWYTNASLMQASDGNFYGVSEYGGLHNAGTAFQLSPGRFTVILDFGLIAGAGPLGPLLQGSDSSLYGTTGGAVFKDTDGVVDVLHNFVIGGDSGPSANGLIEASDGSFYGMTQEASSADGSNCGSIFRISPLGAFETIYALPIDESMGCGPNEFPLIQHTNGLLYGITNNGGSANKGAFFSLDLGLPPFVTFLPAARQIGHTVEILGQGLTGTTAVSFNGTPATTFNVYANTYMTATVPDGATTGFITVTTPGGTLTSNKQFQVKPQITSFSPTSGPVGTSVVVTGVSLSQTSKITFNSVLATSFTVNSDTQVTVAVPAGAPTSKIGFVTTGAPVYSAGAFTVTQ